MARRPSRSAANSPEPLADKRRSERRGTERRRPPAPPAGDGSDTSFEIGLAMAGTVSAGAYTAGVVDFLNEALERYYAAMGRKAWRGPRHKPVIRSIAGTSGGAITAAVYLSTLRRGLKPVRDLLKHYRADREVTSRPEATDDNALYNVWVEKIDVAHLLGSRDIEDRPDGKVVVRALLDTTRLDELADEAMEVDVADPKKRLPWLAKDLELLITCSNLDGVPYATQYTVTERARRRMHRMHLHADYRRFILRNLGGGAYARPRPDYEDIMYPATEVDALVRGRDGAWNQLKEAALASGAVPIVLRARTLTRPYRELHQRVWPVQDPDAPDKTVQINPDLPNSDQAAESLNVDGGIFDNQPLGLISTVMWGRRWSEPHYDRHGNRALLLIDPFLDSFGLQEAAKPDLLGSVAALVRALVNQSSFRPDELRLAVQGDVYSRFIVGPSRRFDAGRLPDQTAASRDSFHSATAGMFGFRGFLAKRFRKHDFQLGRRNCQHLLRNYFVVPQDNPLVKPFHDWCLEAGNKDGPKLQEKYGVFRNGSWHYQIVPLVDEIHPDLEGSKEPTLAWPIFHERELSALGAKLQLRLARVAGKLVEQYFVKPPKVWPRLLDPIAPLKTQVLFAQRLPFDMAVFLPTFFGSWVIGPRIVRAFRKSLVDDQLMRP